MKVCPRCQRKNEALAEKCIECNYNFQVSHTSTLITSRDEVIKQLNATPPPAMPENGVTLMVEGHTTPITLSGISGFILGRQSAFLDVPVIDLSNYQAYALGVSRQHSRIRRTSAGYTIEDMGSANGTHVNNVRLQPGQTQILKTRDKISLGNLTLTFYSFPDET